MATLVTRIHEELLKELDPKYKEFMAKLLPTLDPDTILGIRTPTLRNMIKWIKKDDELGEYLETLPHKYYEENILQSAIISTLKDYNNVIEVLDRFLPYVDNWAVCDIIHPKIFEKNTTLVRAKTNEWLSSTHTYTVRFGISVLMTYFMKEAYSKEIALQVASIRHDDYYVKMMVAWYFATLLDKHYEDGLEVLNEKLLDTWVHNKAIQKAIESRVIPDDRKDYLRTLRIKRTK